MNRFLLLILLPPICLGADWRKADPGWDYQFPRDHGPHPEFKTEWWYFTGNLEGADGRRFGYQLTFFRQGIIPLNERVAGRSRFVVDDLKFAHFTVTDTDGQRFRFAQKVSRGAFGEAGSGNGKRIAWIDEWSLESETGGAFRLRASTLEASIELRLEPAKPPVIHGLDGLSRKAAEPGYASHYYSLTRLKTAGQLRLGDGGTMQVSGESWFDHEWATNQLAPGQIGWDWLSAQLDDGTELMLYQIRRENGSVDAGSSGTFITGAGDHLSANEYEMTPTGFWKSPATGATYPIAWSINIPGRDLQLTVRAVLPDQELRLQPLTYWEGAVHITGMRAGKAVSGHGYLELTGYAAPLRELSR